MLGKVINWAIKPLGIQILKVKKKPVKQFFFEVTDPIEHNSADRMNEFYSDESRIDIYINESRLKFYEKLASIPNKRSEEVQEIVDVGCGTGHLLMNLSNIYPDATCTGLEYVEEAILRARKYFPKANYQVFDINHSYNKQFDLVFCTEVLEHLLYPENAFRNLQSMVRGNGALIISVPEGRKDTFIGHINFWSPESWKVFIESNLPHELTAEFDVIEVDNLFYNVALIQ